MFKNFFLFFISLFVLHSCTINSEIVYHKDAASTSVTDVDIREFMAEMKAMTPDSLQQKEFTDLDKIPTVWTNLYELEKKEMKLKTNDPDSIRIMKKIFLKSSKENNHPAGFALKLEHFTKADFKSLKEFMKQEKLPLEQNLFNDWDGKTLTIDTRDFNLKNIQKALDSKTSPDEKSDEESGKTEGMMMMFFKKVGTTLKFENKIKSITGKHDWLKQIDDHSVRIEYDLKALYDKEAKYKNADQKIIIVTE
ncbi:hypothetical protein N6B72_05780 [Chryseobacterium soli]|uniref:hypothetical protein n=1 Tax=Chryseobacterium soli TaxID=445961 RepID=UPI002953B8F0|nr:hypothetical protein [Chryseobacterium soli]MDV7696426.1 hypothetical protein [Chryseobacterium soli]